MVQHCTYENYGFMIYDIKNRYEHNPKEVHNYHILQSYDKAHFCASCTRHNSWIYCQTAQSTQGLLDYNLKEKNQISIIFLAFITLLA
jgi:ribosomal protein S26